MTCQQSGGGASPAHVVHKFGRFAIEPATAPMPQAIEAAAAAYDDLKGLISGAGAAPTKWPLGKLVAGRPKPRRLDARIVQRRPMMLIKRRPGGAVPYGRIAGREIVARN